MKITYRNAIKEDAGTLVNIYNDAFYGDYIKYGECPAYGKTIEKMELSIIEFPKILIMDSCVPIGTLSFKKIGNDEYYIGCFCVIPKYQHIGIGTGAFEYFQSKIVGWKKISLITPADKEENIRFYTQKCGFSSGKKRLDGNVEVVTLYKER